MDFLELKQRYFGNRATQYDESRVRQPKWARETVELLAVLKDLQGDDLSILDIPCGTGRIIDLLDEEIILFSAYFGADISEDMLAVSRSKIPSELAGKISVTRADAFTYKGHQDVAPSLVLCLRFVNWLDENDLERLFENLKCSGATRICITNRSIQPASNFLSKMISRLTAKLSYSTWKRKQSLHDKSSFLAILGAEWSLDRDVHLESRRDATQLSLLVFKKQQR